VVLAPPLEDDDLLHEILLRLPPQLSYLLRASLVEERRASAMAGQLPDRRCDGEQAEVDCLHRDEIFQQVIHPMILLFHFCSMNQPIHLLWMNFLAAGKESIYLPIFGIFLPTQFKNENSTNP
jgi:hypothetical protein